jgi:hypothetical protein
MIAMRLRLAVAAVLATPMLAAASPVMTGRLDYRLSWNGIPAADATVEVRRDPGAEDLYAVESTARTNIVVDLLYKLRAYAGSRFSTAPEPTPFWFRFDRFINDERQTTDVAFARSPPRATGTHQRTDRPTRVVNVEDAQVLDPVTAIFHALSQPIAVGEMLRYDLFTGESRYAVELNVRSEEMLAIAGGTYRTWRVEPRVWKVSTGREPERRLHNAMVWVSQEPVRTILRVRSEVFIGAVHCDLVRMAPAPS